jgi:hypothetical protein
MRRQEKFSLKNSYTGSLATRACGALYGRMNPGKPVHPVALGNTRSVFQYYWAIIERCHI